MKATLSTHEIEIPPLVAAPVVAKRFSVTTRYILQLADAGRIPCHRLGRKCVRFDLRKVEAALGVEGGAR